MTWITKILQIPKKSYPCHDENYEFEFYRNCCDAQIKGKNPQVKVQMKSFGKYITKIKSKTKILLNIITWITKDAHCMTVSRSGKSYGSLQGF